MKRPYECKVTGCTKTYTTRFSLRRHIASHSVIKKHVCVLCFKTFTLAQYLKEHTYIHTQQKPFKCDAPGCNRSFRQAGKLSMHKKIHQNIIFSVQKVKRRSLQNNQSDQNDTENSRGDHEVHSTDQEEDPDCATMEMQNEESSAVHQEANAPL